MKKRTTAIIDILGISSATLCIIHCVLFPILTIIPIGFSSHHWIDLFFACIGTFVVSRIILSNATRLIKIILFISICITATGIVIELLYDTETNLIVLGGLIMIIGHLLNFKHHIVEKT
jgi:hypothetical protein